MVGQQSSSQSEETTQENQQEQSPPSYEDKLAAKVEEGGFDQQNQVASQVGIAAIFGLAIKGLSVKNARDFLRGEIDINKLVTDPKYKSEVEKAVRLVNRYGFIAKKGDLIEKVPKIERIIERTNACHSKLLSEKSSLLANDNLYLRRLQSAYNLDEKQLQAIKYSAWAKIRENPSLSIKDALRIEAENFSLKRVTQEVEKENRGKKLTNDEKKILIEKKLTEKRVVFETSLTTTSAKTREVKSYVDYEQKRIDSMIKAQIEENKQILTTTTQPTSISVPQPTTAAPPPTPPPVITVPPVISSIPVPGGLSLRNVPIPTFGGFKTGLGILGNGFGKLFGGMGSFIGRRGLGRFVNLAGNLGKKVLNRALDAFLPGLGMTIGKINDVIKSITGIDVEKTILMAAAGLVGAVAALVIIVPIIIGIGVFSHITGDKPMQVSMTNNAQSISWIEFDKQYLTVNTKNQLSWQQFEKDNLYTQKSYLSLDSPQNTR